MNKSGNLAFVRNRNPKAALGNCAGSSELPAGDSGYRMPSRREANARIHFAKKQPELIEG